MNVLTPEFIVEAPPQVFEARPEITEAPAKINEMPPQIADSSDENLSRVYDENQILKDLNTLLAYEAHGAHLNEYWRNYFSTLEDVPTSRQLQSTEKQLKVIVSEKGPAPSPQAIRLFAHARGISPVHDKPYNQQDFSPAKLSDHQLLIEVCCMTGDRELALYLMKRCPSTVRPRMKI
jgi:hypothetical protein